MRVFRIIILSIVKDYYPMAGLLSFDHAHDMHDTDPFIEGLRLIFDARPDLVPAAVSTAAGLDNSTVRKLLNGSNASPRVGTAKRIAKAMGFDLADVISIGEHKNPRTVLKILAEFQSLPPEVLEEALTYAQYLLAQKTEESARATEKVNANQLTVEK